MANDRLKDLEEENELLLLQLHQVQEELESYFLKCQQLEKNKGSVSAIAARTDGWVDDELPEALAEVARLQRLVETQARLHQIESKNSLNARLGDMLIQGASPSGSLTSLPIRLMRIWRASTAQHPPAVLGGNDFVKVIEAYHEGGIEAAQSLLSEIIAPEMRAKAYTTLARHLRNKHLYGEAAESARRAYEEDPQPYRLKWLAFRLHDAGDTIEADACLTLLSQATLFSDSESRLRDQIHNEANKLRLRDAKQNSSFESRRQALTDQLQQLRQDCDKQAQLTAARQSECEALQTQQSRLEQENLALLERQELDSKRVSQLHDEIQSLQEMNERLELKKSALLEQQTVDSETMTQLRDQMRSLQEMHERLELEKSTLLEQQTIDSKTMNQLNDQMQSLQKMNERLELEKSAFLEQQTVDSETMNQLRDQMQSLQEMHDRLELEKAALLEQQTVDSKTMNQLHDQMQSIQEMHERLELEKAALLEQQRIDSKMINQLRDDLQRLQENHALLVQKQGELQQALEEITRERDEYMTLAQHRLKELDELHRQSKEVQAAEENLVHCQQMIREEMARAEAQIDLLKEILLKEPSL